MKTPTENLCWIVPGKLLAGEYSGAEDEAVAREKMAKLTDAGVAAFIDLTDEKDRLEPYGGGGTPALFHSGSPRSVVS